MSRARGVGEKFQTRALSKFVAALGSRTAPIVVDLGPAVGANVMFLGERLGCILRVENLLADKETWLPKLVDDDVEADENSHEPEPPQRTLRIESETVDGVLCWDIFDHLDQDGARALATEITRVLKPGGVVFLCHRSEQCPVSGPGEYEVVDETTVRYRKGADAAPVERVWQSRDMTRMFDQLTVGDSFLLTSRMREILLKRSVVPTRAN